ncbi:MAG: hypothetical protein A2W23_00980 [Planctomycetes bacterium RBG_16_43_13]|nr:MAG: hypothetical protein A2W23_00980 [Planctomycetes bacterium RBG_16_43_13]
MGKIIAVFIIVAFLLGFFLYNHSGFTDTEGRVDLRLVWGQEPVSFDPAIITGVLEDRFAKSFFEGLITYDKDNVTPTPGIAKSWDISSDLKKYTFHLRESKWSNGEPLTAHDFRYSWFRVLNEMDVEYVYMLYYIKGAEAYQNNLTADVMLNAFDSKGSDEKIETLHKLSPFVNLSHRNRLEQILGKEEGTTVKTELAKLIEAASKREAITEESVGIKVLDDYTLEVTLGNPTPFFLDIVGFMTLLPVNKKCVEKYGRSWIKPENMVCNGPFVLAKWMPNHSILMAKNTYYWGKDNVKLSNVLCYSVKKTDTGFNYYETNTVDWIDRFSMPAEFIEYLSLRSDVKKFSSFNTSFLRFNVTKPPFDNVEVRKAFTMAINKEDITKYVTRGGEIPTDFLIPDGIKDYKSPAGLHYNPDKAKQLLKKHYPDIATFPRIEYLTNDRSISGRVFELLQKQWQDILGVKIDIKRQEWKVYLDSLSKLEYNIASGGWMGDYYDPNTFADMWVTGGGNNRTGWGKKEYDDLIAAAATEGDVKKRFEIFYKSEKMILEDETIIVPLYNAVEYIMYKPYVKGLNTNIMSRFLLRNVYIEK